MELQIDIEAPTPVFTQLIEQIKQAVMKNRIHPGDPLPSIRQLANDLALNNKTVAKAYRLLERDSVIQTKGYRGTFIHPDAKTNCAVDLNGWVIGNLTDTIKSFRDRGVTDSEIRIAFSNVMNQREL
ncbi:MAG: GntR family transcriptional regulator [Gammaproteobacteria bacterium]|jgi:GntR family transcriptional regulator|nr:GntR family transcriptional regulator [Gammaproteobacteria bacterium]MBT5601744.1 GntR family transcriptional regulator [Gammaproteobacteria bacterium]MBT6246093.1 GntR family transcriptional regulator [Gammaproteobacteria bacterium]